MAITPGQVADASDFINASEKDATPANDEGRVVKLESDGKISPEFLSSSKAQSIALNASAFLLGLTSSIEMMPTQDNSSTCSFSIPDFGFNTISSGRAWSCVELNTDLYITGTGTLKKYVQSDGYTAGTNITISGGTITVASLSNAKSMTIDYTDNNFYIQSGTLVERFTLSGTVLTYVSSITLSPTTAFSGTTTMGFLNGVMFIHDSSARYLTSFDSSGTETYKSDLIGADKYINIINGALYLYYSNHLTLLRYF